MSIRLLLALFLPLSLLASNLDDLEKKISKEQEYLGYPTISWRQPDDTICDVAIIGGGMLGSAVAYGLQLAGVYNVRVFDAAKSGCEGPWLTTARMKTLRSGKSLQGPALGFAHVTFRGWYEAKYGKSAWKKLEKIPTKMWGMYLIWMKQVLKISVQNEVRLVKIIPNDDETLTLLFDKGNSVLCRKVVLATGRGGFGGFEIPAFLHDVPKKYWAHSSEVISNKSLRDKHVCIIGAGASAFDAAAYALEHKAKNVLMLMRREVIPKDNLFATFGHAGFKLGYYSLSDEKRCELFVKAYSEGIPPPMESIQRVEAYKNFDLLTATCIEKIDENSGKIVLQTNHGKIETDFIFLGTGYAVDGAHQAELAAFNDKILLWKDRLQDLPSKLGRFPYLGPYFEFLENQVGDAPYLHNIHCFNYGAFLSHGRISGDIDCIDVGIKRLVQGIAIQLFVQGMNQTNPYVPTCPNTCE